MADPRNDVTLPFGTYFRTRTKLPADHILTINDIGFFNYGSPNSEPGWKTAGRWIAFVDPLIGIDINVQYADYYSSIQALPGGNLLIDLFNIPKPSTTKDQSGDIRYSNLLASAYPYVGKRVSELPDKLTVHFSSAQDPAGPFGHLAPGIDNPGVDPITGQTPIDALANISAPFLNFLSIIFSMQGLALIGGAILLYLGFKYVMGANANA